MTRYMTAISRKSHDAMKTIYLYPITLIPALVWSCAESGLDFEKETLTTFQLNSLSNKFKVSDFLGGDVPEKLQKSMLRIINNEFGNIVLRKVKAKYSDPVFTRFRPLLDENGKIRKTPAMFLIGGNEILYTSDALIKDALLFHEFFHLHQNPKGIVVKSRNNEVEAYVAQYLYGKWESTISKQFDDAIRYMASRIDKRTGYFKEGTDLAEIQKNYNIALDCLKIHPVYYGGGWFTNVNFDKNNPFPNILNLYRKN